LWTGSTIDKNEQGRVVTAVVQILIREHQVAVFIRNEHLHVGQGMLLLRTGRVKRVGMTVVFVQWFIILIIIILIIIVVDGRRPVIMMRLLLMMIE
jgi:hypothetical protein